MRISFRRQLNTLRVYAHQFDTTGHTTKLTCLRALSSMPLKANQELVMYFETLLFVSAYPSDTIQLSLAQKELRRISAFLKRSGRQVPKQFFNTGMPFTPMISRYSHDGVRWLLYHPDVKVTLDAFADPSLQLNDVLKHTLPSLEKSETSAGMSNTELMAALLIPPSDQLRFIISELARLDSIPYIKDQLYDSLDIQVRIDPKNISFSKAFNRLSQTQTFFHRELIKKFDGDAILHRPLPAPHDFSHTEKEETIRVIKNAMILTARETDPTTFMEENSLRLYHLDRGISVAIYGMVPSRQLPLESYVGYTAFKNGYPAAYGGAWVFGETSNFGMNIFESFRNGESGYIMMQLLRVYRHVFGIRYFEVEPYQFGLDNPDGIASGAYWFYYRFGFRSLSKPLRLLAEKEVEKIRSKKGYRTSEKTLMQFTDSYIGLNLGQHVPPKVVDITSKVTRMIQSHYKGNRALAEEDCRQKFLLASGMKQPLDKDEQQVLTEVSLWAEAMKIKDRLKIEVLHTMVMAKPKDVYAYQACLIRFFSN